MPELLGQNTGNEESISDTLHVDQIMDELRARAARRQGLAAALDDGVATDIAELRTHSDVYHAMAPVRRRFVGRLIALAKRIGRRLLAPSLARQVSYNLVNARVVDALREHCDVLATHQTEAFESLLAAQKESVDELRARIEELRDEHAALRTANRDASREARGALETLREALDRQKQMLLDTQAELQAHRLETQTQGERLQRLTERSDRLGADGHRQTTEAQEDRERIARTERKLRRLLYASANGGEAPQAPHLPHSPPAGASTEPSARPELAQGSRPKPSDAIEEPYFDYLGFEEHFRGSEQDIRERQRPYLDCFGGCSNVLDIGSGRGEFLELLRESSITASGVDDDLDMVLYCREKGLAVEKADVFEYLEGLPEESLGGVFCAQMIEHLPPDHIIRLVKLCRKKLRPDAPLVIETVNPGCLMTFAASFYTDLDHIRPIHSEALKFLLAAEGFRDVTLRFSSPVDAARKLPELAGGPAEFNAGIRRLNDLLYGYQDYAAIGRRDPAHASADPQP